MKLKLLFFILLFTAAMSAQTITFTPVVHTGSYTNGRMVPTVDLEFVVTTPLTSKLSLITYVYYYNSIYQDYPYRVHIYFTETIWYIGVGISYTFSTKPLLE